MRHAAKYTHTTLARTRERKLQIRASPLTVTKRPPHRRAARTSSCILRGERWHARARSGHACARSIANVVCASRAAPAGACASTRRSYQHARRAANNARATRALAAHNNNGARARMDNDSPTLRITGHPKKMEHISVPDSVTRICIRKQTPTHKQPTKHTRNQTNPHQTAHAQTHANQTGRQTNRETDTRSQADIHTDRQTCRTVNLRRISDRAHGMRVRPSPTLASWRLHACAHSRHIATLRNHMHLELLGT